MTDNYQGGLRVAAAIAEKHYKKLKPAEGRFTVDTDAYIGHWMAGVAEDIRKEIEALIKEDFSI